MLFDARSVSRAGFWLNVRACSHAELWVSCLDGGGNEASSSWAPSDHVASGDENVPLDIRDEVISPPTTFAEANAEGGIPSALYAVYPTGWVSLRIFEPSTCSTHLNKSCGCDPLQDSSLVATDHDGHASVSE